MKISTKEDRLNFRLKKRKKLQFEKILISSVVVTLNCCNFLKDNFLKHKDVKTESLSHSRLIA